MSLRNKIITFLRTVADQLENKDLLQREEKLISEFYMKFKFLSEAYQSAERELRNTDLKTESDDFMRYLSLGWYLYNNLPNYEDDQISEENSQKDLA